MENVKILESDISPGKFYIRGWDDGETNWMNDKGEWTASYKAILFDSRKDAQAAVDRYCKPSRCARCKNFKE